VRKKGRRLRESDKVGNLWTVFCFSVGFWGSVRCTKPALDRVSSPAIRLSQVKVIPWASSGRAGFRRAGWRADQSLLDGLPIAESRYHHLAIRQERSRHMRRFDCGSLRSRLCKSPNEREAQAREFARVEIQDRSCTGWSFECRSAQCQPTQRGQYLGAWMLVLVVGSYRDDAVFDTSGWSPPSVMRIRGAQAIKRRHSRVPAGITTNNANQWSAHGLCSCLSGGSTTALEWD
jgi:hypothetical protein